VYELIPKLKISSTKLEFGIIAHTFNNEHTYELLIDVEVKSVFG